jgi:RNA polymerase sigma-70 factor (ECF subfamily)
MTDANDSSERNLRLSRIATQWSMVADAHRASGDAAAARQRLFEQYAAPVYRYLLGAVRNEDVAEELCHEFAARFFAGDFGRADPQRGRFRDYVKRSLSNLVNDYFRTQSRWPRPLPEQAQFAAAEIEEADRAFDASLREEILAQTWKSLEAKHPSYYAVLRLRVDRPDLRSQGVADELNRQRGKHITADTVRKTMERARAKFEELLVEEVAIACNAPTNEELALELQQLDLLKYCVAAMESR